MRGMALVREDEVEELNFDHDEVLMEDVPQCPECFREMQPRRGGGAGRQGGSHYECVECDIHEDDLAREEVEE